MTHTVRGIMERERKFQVWNFRSREQKSCGTFALSEKLSGWCR